MRSFKDLALGIIRGDIRPILVSSLCAILAVVCYIGFVVSYATAGEFMCFIIAAFALVAAIVNAAVLMISLSLKLKKKCQNLKTENLTSETIPEQANTPSSDNELDPTQSFYHDVREISRVAGIQFIITLLPLILFGALGMVFYSVTIDLVFWLLYCGLSIPVLIVSIIISWVNEFRALKCLKALDESFAPKKMLHPIFKVVHWAKIAVLLICCLVLFVFLFTL